MLLGTAIMIISAKAFEMRDAARAVEAIGAHILRARARALGTID